MKSMVSILLLLAICHAGAFGSKNYEAEEINAKRELQEGNFGLKLQPSFFGNSLQSNPRADYGDDKNLREQGPPQKEYGPPRLPVAKISDVLSGQGSSFPAAIQSHLFSRVQVYEPRLGSPTTFEISQPVPSQLAYTEHKIYQATQNIQSLNENLQSLNLQASQATRQPEPSPIQNLLPRFIQLQPPREPRPSLSNEFLPRFEAPRLLPRPDFPETIYRQVFSQQAGVIPQDIYQQINQLGNQITYDETLQISQGSDEEEQRNNQLQKPGLQYADQSQDNVQKIQEQQQSLAQQSTQQPQAVSYASFSQSLPSSFQRQNNDQLEQTPSSPQPLPQLQQLPQPQLPPLFQPSQSTQAQSAFHSIGTTPSPQPTLFTIANQTPRRIGLVRIRQEVTTPQPQTVTTLEPQASSTSAVVTVDDSQPPSTLQQSISTRSTEPPLLDSRSTLTPLSTLAQRTTLQSTTRFENAFPSRPSLPPLPPLPRRPQTTLQSFSTSPLTNNPVTTQTQPTLTTPSILPTLIPATLQPQFIQPTLTPLPVLQGQPLQPIPTQPQFLPTLQPIIVSEAQPLPALPQSIIPGIRGIPVLRQQFQIKSEPQSIIQIQNTNPERTLQQQLTQQPQPQQIHQQLQSIQQQLQLIQQQPQFIQQQPQPVQIIQQQTQPFPQSVQLLPQQQFPQPQSVQLIQSQPQPIQEQSQLVHALPTQLVQPQLVPQQIVQPTQPVQIIQSQPPIQENSQLVQLQPTQATQIQQTSQQQAEPEPKPQVEVQQNSQQSQQEQQKSSQAEKSQKKQEIESSEESNEEDYPQLLHNSEEYYIQPPHLHPVPVAFSSFHGSPGLHASTFHASPFHGSPFHSSPLHAPALHPLHASPLQVSPLRASPLHTSSLQPQSFHGGFPSVQYFGKYSTGIFKGWR